MAGGFLNIAEAAAHLNISEDEIKKLVDQRKLFPLRDTSGFKFKPDELDRFAQDQNDAIDTQDDLQAISGSDVSLSISKKPLFVSWGMVKKGIKFLAA